MTDPHATFWLIEHRQDGEWFVFWRGRDRNRAVALFNRLRRTMGALRITRWPRVPTSTQKETLV